MTLKCPFFENKDKPISVTPPSSLPPRPVPSSLKDVPAYPGGLPFLGHLSAYLKDPPKFLKHLSITHGDIARFKIGLKDVYFINHPDAVHEFLVTHYRYFEKAGAATRAKAVMGHSLVTSTHSDHEPQIKLFQPTFYQANLNRYGRIIRRHTLEMIQRWELKEVVDIQKEMSRLTLSIMIDILFGIRIESHQRLNKSLEICFDHFLKMGLPTGTLFHKIPLPSTMRYFRAKAVFDSTIKQFIGERRRSKRPNNDLLSFMLSSKGKLTDQEIIDHAMTFIIAGHETVATVLTWAFILLSQHPSIEEKCQAELDRSLEKGGDALEQIQKLTYSKMIMAETMRLYPPIWGIPRRAVSDFYFGPYKIPAGSSVVASPFVMHRDQRYYDDPDVFRPERWTPEMKEKRPGFSYFPFGGGPRGCMGEKLGWLEGILILALVNHKWSLKPIRHKPILYNASFTLSPRHPVILKLKGRKIHDHSMDIQRSL